MSTIQTFEILFDTRVRDAASRITLTQKQDAIAQAVKRYAQVRPVVAAQDYAGDGAAFDFALPSGWVTDFSVVRAIEYPAGRRQPSFLERDRWTLYQSPTATVIRLMVSTPSSAETVRVLYTKPHTVDDATSSVPSQDEEAVADLAAALGLRQLAAAFAATVDPTVPGDTADYRSKASEYSKLAADLDKRYRQHLGLDQDAPVQAAGGFVDVDQASSLGQDKLTHPNRNR